jgi:hypothetical protein
VTRARKVNRRQPIALAATGVASLAGCGRTDHGAALYVILGGRRCPDAGGHRRALPVQPADDVTAAHGSITRFEALHRRYNGEGLWIPTPLTPPAFAA